jgi:hypothetical protein
MSAEKWRGQRPSPGSGKEGHEQRQGHASTGRLASRDAARHLRDALSVEANHRDDCARLDYDGVGVGGLTASDSQKALGDEQMSRRTDREVLRQPLHEAQDQCLPPAHGRSISHLVGVSSLVIGAMPRQPPVHDT